MSILDIGLSGLRVAQNALATTSHNIANAGVAGYSRQEVVQTPAHAMLTGAGYIGQGTSVQTVRRLYSEFLANHALATSSGQAELESLRTLLARLDGLLGDPAAGLAPAFEAFLDALSAANAQPGETASRTALLGTAQGLAGRFGAIAGQLDSMRAQANDAVNAGVSAVNALASRIAKLNGVIPGAYGSGGHAPNDLLDRRDALVAELAREIGISVVRRQDGVYDVFVASGQPLVVGGEALELRAMPAPDDPSRMTVALSTPGGAVYLPETALSGGALGGALAFRNGPLEAARNGIGRIALVLAGSFNAQHRLGQTLQGTPGGDFFSVAAPHVVASAGNAAALEASVVDYTRLQASAYRLEYDGASYSVTRLSDGTRQTFAALPATVDGLAFAVTSGAMAPGDTFTINAVAPAAGSLRVSVPNAGAIALASPVRTRAGAANSGNAAIDAGTVMGPPPADANLLQPVTLTFTSASTFDVTGVGTGNPTGVTFTPGEPITYNGWRVVITGSPAAGDVFVIEPNTGGVGDNRNGLALAALVHERLVGGSATLQGAYVEEVARAGTAAAETRIAARAQDAIHAQAERARDALSGVNLDEEAANLMRYQQAYQAAAKVMQIASRLFESVLELGR